MRDFLDLVLAQRLGDVLHLERVGLAGIGAVAQTLLEVVQLLHDVLVGQALHRRVLRPSAAVRQVAQAARARHARLAARHRRRHRRVVVGEPVGRSVAEADLRLRELKLRPCCLTHHRRLAVGRRRVGIGDGRRRWRGHLRRDDARRKRRRGVGPGRRHFGGRLTSRDRAKDKARGQGTRQDRQSHRGSISSHDFRAFTS